MPLLGLKDSEVSSAVQPLLTTKVDGAKNADRTTLSGSCTTTKVKNEDKGTEVSSLVQLQPTTTVDGEKNVDRTTFSGSCTTTKVNAEDYHSSKMKEFNNLKDNLQCLWDTLVVQCQLRPLVDHILFNKCMEYITALSRTPRTYRRAATLRGLQLVTSFISVANTLAARRETARRQFDAEKKKQTEGPRVESLNKRFSMTHDKITMLEQMMCKISIGRVDAFVPITVLQGVYLMYFGLALNDKGAGVRNAFVHALKNLYGVNDSGPSLGRFTTRLSSQMIAIVGDIDISSAISATDLVKQLLRHELLPPEIRHVIGLLEYEHLIAQKFNSSQSGAKGFSCQDHGTINIAKRWGHFICVGVDSKLSNGSGDVTDLAYNKFHQISRNIYITMAGLRTKWEDMFHWIKFVFSGLSEELHTVELAANLAYQYDCPSNMVGSLVLGWDITSPHPQMFRVIVHTSCTTSNNAMAVGTGQQFINMQNLTNSHNEELANTFRHTMSLLEQACLLDPYCGGTVRGWVLQRDQPSSCQYINSFN